MKLLKLESRVAMANDEGEKAIKVLEQIAERDPLDGEALLLAGDYYLRSGETEKAEFRYDQAAKIQGFEADAFVKQAQLLVRSAKYVEAVEALKKAQRIEPRDNVQRYLDKVEELARNTHS
jgi:Flp pilus assembly protein TadD